MVERDLTLENGLINKQLPPGFYFFRIADSGKREFNKTGFDGFLMFYNKYCWPVEVKITNKISSLKKLTSNEEKTAERLKSKKIKYMILTYVINLNVWVMQFYGEESQQVGTLEQLMEDLID